MSSNEVVISVKNVSKCYQIYNTPRARLKQFILPYLFKVLGKQVKQYYNDFWALKDISFEIKKGDTVGIIGRNGSGKSTLLQIICGTLSPTSGSIETHGRIAALLELGSGFNPEFTGRENVYLNAALLGLNKTEIDARIHLIVEFADIGDHVDQPVKTYSSGMYVRLAFAVIAHVDADILIVDEALSVGDAFFTQKCMRFLRKFMETGTVLFVSHDTSAVINLCSRAIWINQGKLISTGSPKNVSQDYLAALHNSNSIESTNAINTEANQPKHVERDFPRDMRTEFINNSNFRNDIEILNLKTDSSGFGKGDGKILSVLLTDRYDQRLSWIVGGEAVRLKIVCFSTLEIEKPIIGFYVNDRLGQTLFGDNTFNFLADSVINISKGQQFYALFDFIMPILPSGDYTISAALASGTQHDHIQHHWIHEALFFKSHSSSVSKGLIGIPMSNIDFMKIER